MHVGGAPVEPLQRRVRHGFPCQPLETNRKKKKRRKDNAESALVVAVVVVCVGLCVWGCVCGVVTICMVFFCKFIPLFALLF